MKTEIFKDIPGYEGKYKVNPYGVVYCIGTERNTKPYYSSKNTGYVRLSKNNKVTAFQIGIVVAMAFVPNYNGHVRIDYIDGNPLNTHFTNIKWIDGISKSVRMRGARTGIKKNRSYSTYYNMLSRCYNSKRDVFFNYGGRGISVCLRWKESFYNFLEDMGERPQGLSLDRINNNGNYEPSNCRWATIIEQNNNKRTSINQRNQQMKTIKMFYKGILFTMDNPEHLLTTEDDKPCNWDNIIEDEPVFIDGQKFARYGSNGSKVVILNSLTWDEEEQTVTYG